MMRTTRYWWVPCFLTAALPLIIAAPALAEDTAAATPASGTESDNGGLVEIVVTAQRKSENVLRVPVSISAATGDQLISAGIDQISSLQFTVPGFYTDNGVGYTQIYLRGIGNNIFVGADPSVLTNIDDVPRIYGSLVNNFVNVDRVEVLKGAQGGLYGRNATGGVVNIITRQPSDTAEADARVSYGQKNTLEVALYGNLPINDVIAWNVSFQRDSHDNYVKNLLQPNPLTAANFPDGGGPLLGLPPNQGGPPTTVVTPAQTAAFFNSAINPQSGYGNQDFWAGDTKVRLQLAPNFKVTVDADWSQKHDSDGDQWFLQTPAYSQGYDAAVLGAFGVNIVLPPGFYKPVTHSFTNYNSTPAADWLTDYGLSIRPEWNLPGVDITNIAAYRQQQTLYTQNYASPITVDIPTVDNSKWYLYEELRAISTGSGPFHFLGGATYLRDHSLGKTTNVLFPPLCCIPALAGAGINTFVQSTDLVNNWSVYGQVGYDITSKLNFTTSLRFIHETNKANFTNPINSESSIDAKKFLPSATLSYALDGGGNVYVRYAKGFKAGGVNPVVPPTLFPNDNGKVFGPEQVNTYEAGYKDELFDHHVQVTSAVFYNDYTGLQYTTTGNAAHPQLIEAIVNAGTAETYGAEGSVAWRVVRPLTLTANAAYLQAKYRSFSNSDGSVLATFNFNGNRMINSPRWQMAFTAGLDQPITGNLNLTGTWQTAYTSDVVTAYTVYPGVPNGFIPQFWLTNLRIGVKTPDDRYQFSIFANNAFDRAYYTFNSISGLGSNALWGNPRIVGGEFHVKFH
jgi:iron complex outermembrane receptor protein